MRSPRTAHLLLPTLVLLALCCAIAPAHATPGSPAGDALVPPPRGPSLAAADDDPRPAADQPSAFLARRVAVQIVFVESDGGAEPSTEDWTPDQIAGIQAHVGAALDWWRVHLPNAQLSFDVTTAVAGSRYEPINQTLSTEGLWIGDALTRLGYAGATYFDQAYAADEALRRARHTDWATTIFVANSAADADGRFDDNFFAYAYIGGPFLVITSDVGLYGTAQMTPIVAHEFGHIFGALDQYAAANTPCSQRSGYLDLPTSNSQDNGCGTQLASIMLDPVVAYAGGQIDASALGQVGYRDADGNGRPDPLDTAPALQLTISLPPEGDQPSVTGEVRDQPYPAPQQRPASINTITLAEYRIDGGPWSVLPPADGSYDGAAETISATLPLYDGQHQIVLRARNSVGAFSPATTAQVVVQGVGAQPPYEVSVPALSNTTAISVGLAAPAGSSVQVSEDPLFGGAAWVAASPSVPWRLDAAEGPHTLYIRFRDSAGREAPPLVRTVLLDRDPPRGRAIIRPGAPPHLELDVQDSGSGVAAFALSAERDAPPNWRPFQPSSALPAGTERVWVRLRDAAGNSSQPLLAQDSYLTYLPLIRAP